MGNNNREIIRTEEEKNVADDYIHTETSINKKGLIAFLLSLIFPLATVIFTMTSGFDPNSFEQPALKLIYIEESVLLPIAAALLGFLLISKKKAKLPAPVYRKRHEPNKAIGGIDKYEKASLIITIIQLIMSSMAAICLIGFLFKK